MKKAFPETGVPQRTFLDLNPVIFDKQNKALPKPPPNEGWFSVADYVKHCGCAASTARNKLHSLVQKGVIEECHFSSIQGNRTSYYREINKNEDH